MKLYSFMINQNPLNRIDVMALSMEEAENQILIKVYFRLFSITK